MKRSLEQLAVLLRGRLLGDGNVVVTEVSSISSAAPGSLVFVEDARHLPGALQSPASAVIAGEFAAESNSAKPILICAQPRLAFAQAAAVLHAAPAHKRGIHPGAVVHVSAQVAASASVDVRAVIAENVEIGDSSHVGAGTVIGANVKIGTNCEIYPNVTIYPNVHIGNHVIVHAGAVLGSDGFGYARDRDTGRYTKFPQIGRLVIEDDVEIGANTTIDRGALETTRIGRGTKIDNLVHIGHNCQVGEDVVIAAQAGFSGSVILENQVVLGGQVGIGEHARLTEGVMVGGQGGILPHKVLRGKGAAFWGTPAQPLREYLKQLAAVARLGKK